MYPPLEQFILPLSNKKKYPEMFKLETMGSPNLYSLGSWDEKGKNMISNIYVTFNNFGIKSIQFIYFHEGVHVESQKHGYSGGQHIERVSFFFLY